MVFVRDIAKPIESWKWDVRCFYNEERWRDYFQNLFDKKLAGRAVANYKKKSIETLGDLFDIDEKMAEATVFSKRSKVLP